MKRRWLVALTLLAACGSPLAADPLDDIVKELTPQYEAYVQVLRELNAELNLTFRTASPIPVQRPNLEAHSSPLSSGSIARFTEIVITIQQFRKPDRFGHAAAEWLKERLEFLSRPNREGKRRTIRPMMIGSHEGSLIEDLGVTVFGKVKAELVWRCGNLVIECRSERNPLPDEFEEQAPRLLPLLVQTVRETAPRVDQKLTQAKVCEEEPTSTVPLVIVLDIDGTRQDFLYQMLFDGKLPNLGRILGKRISADPSGIPIENHVSTDPLHRLEFEHGIALLNATTVFPSFTFAGQASIFTGVPPGQHGITGNEFLDRFRGGVFGNAPRLWTFTGNEIPLLLNPFDGLPSIAGTSPGDALIAYSIGAAQAQLRVPTVYELLKREQIVDRAAIVFNMYFGAEADWIPAGGSTGLSGKALEEFLLYHAVDTTRDYDRLMTDRGLARLDEWVAADGQGKLKPAILTLYFAGVDHLGHELGIQEQQKYLLETVEPNIGRLLERLDKQKLLGRATFVLTADHGQTDVSSGEALTWSKLRKILGSEIGLGNDFFSWPLAASLDRASVVAALNGGMAHVYVSHELRRNDWNRSALRQDVLNLANLFFLRDASGGGVGPNPLGFLDLILVREPTTAGMGLPQNPYRVFVRSRTDTTFDLVDLETYFRSEAGRRLIRDRWGWKWDTDTAVTFLARRIQQVNSDRSGDILLLPRYPVYYFDHSALKGEHGSLLTTDMFVPFIVARPPGLNGMSNADPVRKTLLDLISASLGDRQFSSNMDATRVIQNVFRAAKQAR